MSRSPAARYRDIAAMTCALFRAQWRVHHRPFQETASRLSRPLPWQNPEVESAEAAREVRADLGTLCRYLPWSPTCLVKAVAAHGLLARRGVAATLVLSVMPGGQAAVSAHAWLEAAGLVVTGRGEMGKFTPIYRFDNRGPEGLPSPCSR